MILNKYLKILFIFLPFIVNVVFFTLVFKQVGTGFLLIHDSAIVLQKQELSGFNSLWNYKNFGYANFAYFSGGFPINIVSSGLLFLGLSTSKMEFLSYVLTINALFYIAWLYFKKIIVLLEFKESKDKIFLASFVSAVLYSYNIVILNFVHGGIFEALSLYIISAPVIMYFILKLLLNKSKLIEDIQLGLWASLAISTAPFFLAFILPLAVFFLFFLSVKKILHGIVAVIVCCILSVSHLYLMFQSSINADPFPIQNGLLNYAFTSHGLLDVVRFFADWTLNAYWYGTYFHHYYKLISHPILIAATFVIWAIVIWNLFITRDEFKKSSSAIYNTYILLGSCLLLSMILMKGNQEPFGFFNKFLYENIPVMGIFRTPATKFILGITLIISIVIGHSILLAKKKWIVVLVLVSVFLQIFPFFNPTNIIEKKQGSAFKRIVNIPSEYHAFANYINTHDNGTYVLFYEGKSFARFNFKNGEGIIGQDILGRLLKKPVIYYDGYTYARSVETYKEITTNLDTANFGEYSIGYVLLRRDVDENDYFTAIKKIKLNSNAVEVLDNKLGTLYAVKTSSIKPLVEVINGKEIIYRTAFHPDLGIMINKTDLNLKHETYNNYANKWSSPNVLDIHSIQPYFKKDSFFYALLKVNVAMYIFVVIGIIFYTVFSRRKNLNV